MRFAYLWKGHALVASEKYECSYYQ
jgi:hypothetical protein